MCRLNMLPRLCRKNDQQTTYYLPAMLCYHSRKTPLLHQMSPGRILRVEYRKYSRQYMTPKSLADCPGSALVPTFCFNQCIPRPRLVSFRFPSTANSISLSIHGQSIVEKCYSKTPSCSLSARPRNLNWKPKPETLLMFQHAGTVINPTCTHHRPASSASSSAQPLTSRL